MVSSEMRLGEKKAPKTHFEAYKITLQLFSLLWAVIHRKLHYPSTTNPGYFKIL
jgi:hypothetical protein